jgi:hypothetical protein
MDLNPGARRANETNSEEVAVRRGTIHHPGSNSALSDYLGHAQCWGERARANSRGASESHRRLRTERAGPERFKRGTSGHSAGISGQMTIA